MSFVGKLLKKFKFITKGVVALNILLISATYGFLSSIFLTIIGKKDISQWSTARFYYNLFSFIMGTNINIDRPELLEKLPAILISNHQSELDIYMLGRIFPKKCVVTAKKQLKYIPFLGWFMSASGTFFLDRSNKESAIQTLNKALDKLKTNKGGLFMFPEGTRSYSNKPILLPFKKGAFHLAVQAQIPIIPLVVSNTSNIYSLKEYNFNRGEINIKVLDPIPTEGLTKDDVTKLTHEVYDKMNQAVSELGMSKVYGEECVSTQQSGEDNGEDNDEETEVEETHVSTKSTLSTDSHNLNENTSLMAN
ncbi:hypothetical protein CANINC_002339 [Pichia inconspicua]|uniref:1-acyl-sn-glycerol-3-phosphate acyltransferase n=1 Tax=Pichia inconspicua TaxID=52247 RepID=A0A4T0X2P4_9ASCO|nr:hypothetical protein CANINC_002339 [[Candida] inconspicua]